MAFQKEQSDIKEVLKFSAVTRSLASGRGTKKCQADREKFVEFRRNPFPYSLKSFLSSVRDLDKKSGFHLIVNCGFLGIV